MNTDKGSSNEFKDQGWSRPWPWGAQFVLVVLGLLLAGTLLVGLPILVASKFGATYGVSDANVWSPMIAALLGLTTMTITGIFLFMTLRIDRGTKNTARTMARKVARKEVKAAEKDLKNFRQRAKDTLKKQQQTMDKFEAEIRDSLEERIQKEVSELSKSYLTEESLRNMAKEVVEKRLVEQAVKCMAEMSSERKRGFIVNLKVVIREIRNSLKR